MSLTNLVVYWKKMAQVTITINSREYAVACEDGQEARILQLARILDEKAKMLTVGGQQVNENMLLAMVGLLLADELSEIKKGAPVVVANPDAASPAEINAADEALAQQIILLANQIKSVANQIESL